MLILGAQRLLSSQIPPPLLPSKLPRCAPSRFEEKGSQNSISFEFFEHGLTIYRAENHYGFLSNIWDLRITRIDDFTKVFFCYSILYSLSLATIKISIVFLYLRIFRAQGVLVNYIIIGTQVFNVIIFLIFLVGLFVACRPLAYYWSYADPLTGTCPDPIDRGLVYPVLNVIMDAWLLILPMSQIWFMGLSWRSKLGVLAMFGLGLV